MDSQQDTEIVNVHVYVLCKNSFIVFLLEWGWIYLQFHILLLQRKPVLNGQLCLDQSDFLKELYYIYWRVDIEQPVRVKYGNRQNTRFFHFIVLKSNDLQIDLYTMIHTPASFSHILYTYPFTKLCRLGSSNSKPISLSILQLFLHHFTCLL